MNCIVNIFELLAPGYITGGQWSEIGSSQFITTPVSNIDLDSTGVPSGTYTFEYSIPNSCYIPVQVDFIVENPVSVMPLTYCNNASTNPNLYTDFGISNTLYDIFLYTDNTYTTLVSNFNISTGILDVSSVSADSTYYVQIVKKFANNGTTPYYNDCCIVNTTISVGIATIDLNIGATSTSMVAINNCNSGVNLQLNVTGSFLDCTSCCSNSVNTTDLITLQHQIFLNTTSSSPIVSFTIPAPTCTDSYSSSRPIPEDVYCDLNVGDTLISVLTISNSNPNVNCTLLNTTAQITHTVTQADIDLCLCSLCDSCGLEWDSNTVLSSIGLLEVGEISSTAGCNVSEYVIEWYLGDPNTTGVLDFTSGYDSTSGTSTESMAIAGYTIDIHHSFTGTSALPAVGGMYYPVIKHIIIDGTTYSSADFPDLEDCLPLIDVVNLRCDNGGNNTYAHNISYNSLNQSGSNNIKDRELILEIDPTMPYIPFYFRGYDIVDCLNIYLNQGGTETQVIGLQAGTGLTGNNLNNLLALEYDNSFDFKHVINLTSFTLSSTDFLRIEIIGDCLNTGNTNLQWLFGISCKSLFNCPSCTGDANILSNVTCTVNANCSISINYNTNKICDYGDAALSTLISVPSLGGVNRMLPDGSVSVLINRSFTCGLDYKTLYNNGPCYDIPGGMTITKTGNTYTFDFNTDSTLYNNYATTLMGMFSDTHYTGTGTYGQDGYIPAYSSNSADLGYYKFFTMRFFNQNICGDTENNMTFDFHLSSNITYDNVNNIITIEAVSITDQYGGDSPALPCGADCSNAIPTIVNEITDTINIPDGIYNIQSLSNLATVIIATMSHKELGQTTSQVNNVFIQIDNNNLCVPYNCNTNTSGSTATLIYNLRHTITLLPNSTGGYDCDNFKIEARNLDSNGCPASGTTLLYDKINGIETYY